MAMTPEETVRALLAPAGITPNGKQPFDPQILDERFYARILSGGSLALGESYMDRWWECKRLDEFFSRLLAQGIDKSAALTLQVLLMALKQRLLNLQTRMFVRGNIAHHYDIGNDLYEAMLDPTMTYSCGYWRDARTLEQAQLAKYELICRKLGIRKGMRILDIGCGWGGFAEYAARTHQAKVVGITLSKEQLRLAKKRVKSKNVSFRLQDYREVEERFDHIVSIGMFEHVGAKNYRTYFKSARRALNPGGLLLLHTIGRNTSSLGTDPWISTYIFPNSMLPSEQQIARGKEGLFVLEDWHSFGADYDKTLMAWHANFSKAWPTLSKSYDERFRRMWEYYLLACAGSFRCRKNQLWQLVLSPEGVRGGYVRP